jgi:hypothetical protein
MTLFFETYRSSEQFKFMMDTFGLSTQDKLAEMMLQRVNNFTSLNISGFMTRNNI